MNTHQGYAKQTLSGDYVLLANGGHKPLSDFATNSHTHTTTCSVDTLTSTTAVNLTAGITVNGVSASNTLNDIYSAALVARTSVSAVNGTLVLYLSQNVTATALNYTNDLTTANMGSATKVYVPLGATLDGNALILRLFWSSSYWKEIFVSPNNMQIFYRGRIGNSNSNVSKWFIIPRIEYPNTSSALSALATIGSSTVPVYIEDGIFKTCSISSSSASTLYFGNGGTSNVMSYNTSAVRYFKTDGVTLYASGSGTSSSPYTLRTILYGINDGTEVNTAINSLVDGSYGIFYTANRAPYSNAAAAVLTMRRVSNVNIQISAEVFELFGMWYRYMSGSWSNWKKILVNSKYAMTNVADIGELTPISSLIYYSPNILFGFPASKTTITGNNDALSTLNKTDFFTNGHVINMKYSSVTDLVITLDASATSSENSPIYGEIYGFGIDFATRGYPSTVKIEAIKYDNTSTTLYDGEINGNGGLNFYGTQIVKVGGYSSQYLDSDRYFKLKFTFTRGANSTTGQNNMAPYVRQIKAFTINKWLLPDIGSSYAMTASGVYADLKPVISNGSSNYSFTVKVGGATSNEYVPRYATNSLKALWLTAGTALINGRSASAYQLNTVNIYTYSKFPVDSTYNTSVDYDQITTSLEFCLLTFSSTDTPSWSTSSATNTWTIYMGTYGRIFFEKNNHPTSAPRRIMTSDSSDCNFKVKSANIRGVNNQGYSLYVYKGDTWINSYSDTNKMYVFAPAVFKSRRNDEDARAFMTFSNSVDPSITSHTNSFYNIELASAEIDGYESNGATFYYRSTREVATHTGDHHTFYKMFNFKHLPSYLSIHCSTNLTEYFYICLPPPTNIPLGSIMVIDVGKCATTYIGVAKSDFYLPANQIPRSPLYTEYLDTSKNYFGDANGNSTRSTVNPNSNYGVLVLISSWVLSNGTWNRGYKALNRDSGF